MAVAAQMCFGRCTGAATGGDEMDTQVDTRWDRDRSAVHSPLGYLLGMGQEEDIRQCN